MQLPGCRNTPPGGTWGLGMDAGPTRGASRRGVPMDALEWELVAWPLRPSLGEGRRPQRLSPRTLSQTLGT